MINLITRLYQTSNQTTLPKIHTKQQKKNNKGEGRFELGTTGT